MKKIFILLVIAMITMVGQNGFAYTPPAQPANGWYVVDRAGKLSSNDLQRLNQKIEQLNKNTRNEYAILLLQEMDGNNIEDVAYTTFNAWGVGKKDLDNGILIVVAIKERKSRIETGKGVGGELPDLRANDILKKNLNPHLKNDDFYGGLNETLDAISGYLESRANQKTEPKSSSGCSVVAAGTSGSLGLAMTGLLILVMVGGFLWIRAMQRKEQRRAADLIRAQQERDRQAAERQRKLEIAAESLRRESEERIRRVAAAVRANKISAPPPVAAVAAKPVTFVPVIRPKPITSPKTISPVGIPAPSVMGKQRALEQSNREKREEEKRKQRREDEQRFDAARRQREHEEEERRLAQQREEENRRRRDQEESDRRRREDDDRRNSISSSFDWGSSSSSSWDSGGSSFGGGDSGGGGSSSDW